MPDSGAVGHTPTQGGGFQTRWPDTTLGKWSLWLAVAFLAMFVVNSAFVGVFGQSNDAVLNEFSRTYLPFYGIALMLTGAATGVLALLAIVRQRERSIVTLITLAPLLFVVVFLLGEFLLPH